MGGNPMMLQIKRWLAPSVFPDDEIKTRRAILLNAALISILTLVPVLFIGNWLGGKTPLPVFGANVLAFALCWVLRSWMHRGRVRLASIGLMTMGLVLITASAASLGTIRAPTTAMYLLMVITGGLLFDLRGMIITTALCSLLIGGLIGAENTGLLPRPDYAVTITQWVAYTALFVWTGSLTFSALQVMRQALARADKEIAERKRAEEALRASEERFSKAFRLSPTGIAIFRAADGRFVDVNDVFVKTSGYTREEIIGHTAAELQLYANPEERELTFRALRERGLPEPFEFKARTKSGEVCVGLSATAEITLGGEKHYLSMILDITERKRVQSIMQARLRLLEFASSHSMDELLTATLDEIQALTGSTIGFYHFLEADQKTLSLQNWSTNTLKTMCTAAGKGCHYDIAQAGVWVDCVHERRPIIHNDYASLPHRKGLPEGHAPVIREVVVPIFRGNLIKAIIGVGNKSTPYDESDIEIVSQLGDLSWDITERKRAEEALKEQYSTLHSIIDSTNALIFSVDRQYRYTSFNKGHAAVMKAIYGAEIETGRSLLDYMTVTEDRETAKRNLDRALAGEQLVEEAYSGEALRSRRYFQVSHSPIRTEDGQVIGVAVLAQDITERKQAEEALLERERFLDSIFTSIQDGISVLDRDMNIIRVNPTMEEWYAHALPLVT